MGVRGPQSDLCVRVCVGSRGSGLRWMKKEGGEAAGGGVIRQSEEISMSVVRVSPTARIKR